MKRVDFSKIEYRNPELKESNSKSGVWNTPEQIDVPEYISEENVLII